MAEESKSIPLSLDELRALGGWAAACAERALPVFESYAPTDPRPRAAIEGIRAFAAGGNRTTELRKLSLAALAAAKDAENPAASAAARAAGVAASSAYTHPLATSHQTRHILGPPAYAALALELDQGGDPSVAEREVRFAIEHAPSEVGAILRRMPRCHAGRSRLGALLGELDAGLRGPES